MKVKIKTKIKEVIKANKSKKQIKNKS